MPDAVRCAGLSIESLAVLVVIRKATVYRWMTEKV